MSEWTKEQSAQAQAEGWDVFSVQRDDGRMYELERLDDPGLDNPAMPEPLFETDAAAWVHVKRQADAGSTLHRAALDFLQERAPLEWAEIDAHKPPASEEPTT